MAGTRSTKRAPSLAADVETDANGASQPAQKRTRRAATGKQQQANDSSSSVPAPSKTSKAKASAQPQDQQALAGEDSTGDSVPSARPSRKAKGKSQTDVADNDDDGLTQASKTAKAATKRKGKAEVKPAPGDDDQGEVKDDAAQAIAGASKPAEDGQNDIAPDISDAQFAKSKYLRVPLDEECYLASHKVHVDSSDGIIYDAALNQANAGNNNNKFYKIQLLTDGNDYRTWTRWGRVGERGQNALLGNGSFQDALDNFNKKFKDKTGLTWDSRGSEPKSKKYVFVERSYEPDSDEEKAPKSKSKSKGTNGADRASPPKCTLEPPVKALMEMIFNQEYFDQVMQELNYDPKKLPLGKLSKATITRGYQALKDLAALLNDPSLAASKYGTDSVAAVEDLSNRYYSYIPHAFGRNKPPVIRSHDMLKREIDLMDSLTDLKDADQIIKAENDDPDPVHPLDSRFNGLGMQEMSVVGSKTNEFKEISQYLVKTCGQTHSIDYQVRDIFRIERQGENDRFDQSNFSKIESDRRLLWHGSRATNFGGILSQGLRIAPPEAPVSGYMFGKGIYLADMSSKSANYCCSHISGGEALLLLCEAELGQPMQTLKDASYSAGEDAIAKGMWSTWGQGSNGPKAWKDASCVHPSLTGVSMPDTKQTPGSTGIQGGGGWGFGLYYNEYICYDVAQVRLRYLLRVRT